MTKSKTIGGMGFWDFAMFNDSLLAKQAWRLLHDKSSLFYKVFKACFFPNSTIMEAADSRMGSYAWKSILRGRNIIQRGALWRIGNGEKMNLLLLWKDKIEIILLLLLLLLLWTYCSLKQWGNKKNFLILLLKSFSPRFERNKNNWVKNSTHPISFSPFSPLINDRKS